MKNNIIFKLNKIYIYIILHINKMKLIKNLFITLNNNNNLYCYLFPFPDINDIISFFNLNIDPNNIPIEYISFLVGMFFLMKILEEQKRLEQEELEKPKYADIQLNDPDIDLD